MANHVCAHCGRVLADHYSVNYADGPHISGPVLICPTSVFKEESDDDANLSRETRERRISAGVD